MPGDGSSADSPGVSCKQILDDGHDTGTGEYWIDPPGGVGVISVFCEMEFEDGGWTRVFIDEFQPEPQPGWTDAATVMCGQLGMVLGPHTGPVDRTIDLLGIEHGEMWLDGTMVFLDSWDGELGWILVDGTQVWAQDCQLNDEEKCDSAFNLCGQPFWADGLVDFKPVFQTEEPTVNLQFDSSLDEGTDNEAYGVASLEVYVR